MIPAKVLFLRTAAAQVIRKEGDPRGFGCRKGESRLTCLRGGGGLLRQVWRTCLRRFRRGEAWETYRFRFVLEIYASTSYR